MDSLWVAKTGLEAQQMRMSIVSQNLANVNTTGFKRRRARFSRTCSIRTLCRPAGSTSQQSSTPTGLNLGTGVRVVATDKQFDSGQSRHDEQSARSCRSGPGLLRDSASRRQPAYTRDGTFQLNLRRPSRDVERLRAAALRHDSGRGSVRDDRLDGVVSVVHAGSGRSGPGRHAAAHRFRQSGGTASARRESLPRDRLERSAAARHARA